MDNNNTISFSKSVEDNIKEESNDTSSEFEENSSSQPHKQDSNLLLFVDVNLGPSRMERIEVYEGDTAIKLATKFSQEHNLNPLMKQKLIELLN